jgi:hypothetical protein
MMKYSFWIMVATLLSGFISPASAADDFQWTTDRVFKRVAPLKNDNTGRLAMITWPAFVLGTNDVSFRQKAPLPPEAYKELARRGLTQRIPLHPDYIPMAQAIQAAGAQVIFVEGTAGPGPYALGAAPYHKLPADFPTGKDRGQLPCPAVLDGWAKSADRIRATLRQYKEAGVKVTGVWLDWEVEPWAMGGYKQAAACSRCREILPRGVLDSSETYTRYIVALRAQMFSAYVAAPVLEVFPGCPVTDWAVVFSTLEVPTQGVWGNYQQPPRDLGLFTAANPVAYGNDIFYEYHWTNTWGYPLDIPHMDRLYTRVMLGQVSQHAANALKLAPEKLTIPWVCRYCPDADDRKVPLLSRERYREILRHIWLRGADSMQIFNEPRKKYPAIAVEEVEDAVAIYDEMLAYREFLDRGEIMNTAVPEVTDDGPVWSGFRLKDEAIVRAFTQGRKTVKLNLAVWDSLPAVELDAPPGGATYRLAREGERIRVTREKTPRR